MPLEISLNGGVAAFHASARTFSAAAGGGTFGVAYRGIPAPEGALSEAWILGLKQDGLSRSNLAFGIRRAARGVSRHPTDSTLSVDFFDGDFGFSGERSVSLSRPLSTGCS